MIPTLVSYPPRKIDWNLATFAVRACGEVNQEVGINIQERHVSARIVGRSDPYFEFPAMGNFDRVAIIAGSNDGDDWRSNFNLELIPTLDRRPGRIARGFRQDYKLVKDRMLRDLVLSQRVLLLAHSRGHALACQLLEDLHDFGVEVVLYTLGGPRWCDKERARHFNARGIEGYRIVVGGDCVPRIPKRSMGYAHVLKGVYSTVDGRLTLSQELDLLRPWRIFFNNFRHHVVLDSYARAIRILAEKQNAASGRALELLAAAGRATRGLVSALVMAWVLTGCILSTPAPKSASVEEPLAMPPGITTNGDSTQVVQP